jgi:hypothetical protein
MGYRNDRATNARRTSAAVVYVMVFFPVVVCAALYAYYFVAQAVVNPMPVEGVLKSAQCQPAGISRQGVQTSIPSVRIVYEFPSRSRAPRNSTVGHPRGLDEITEYIDYDTSDACEAAARALVPGSTRTVWAGENDMSDRFRARLTAERRYPPFTLLWVPGCLAAMVLWGRSRLVARRRLPPLA